MTDPLVAYHLEIQGMDGEIALQAFAYQTGDISFAMDANDETGRPVRISAIFAASDVPEIARRLRLLFTVAKLRAEDDARGP